MLNLDLNPDGIRVIICGGRHWNARDITFTALDRLHRKHQFTAVIHGDARGADTLADQWAKARGLPVSRYPAQWDTYGRSAGHRRNQQMLDQGQPDLVVAFPGGVGTASMMAKAKAAGVPVINLADIRHWWAKQQTGPAAIVAATP